MAKIENKKVKDPLNLVAKTHIVGGEYSTSLRWARSRLGLNQSRYTTKDLVEKHNINYSYHSDHKKLSDMHVKLKHLTDKYELKDEDVSNLFGVREHMARQWRMKRKEIEEPYKTMIDTLHSTDITSHYAIDKNILFSNIWPQLSSGHVTKRSLLGIYNRCGVPIQKKVQLDKELGDLTNNIKFIMMTDKNIKTIIVYSLRADRLNPLKCETKTLLKQVVKENSYSFPIDPSTNTKQSYKDFIESVRWEELAEYWDNIDLDKIEV